MTKPAMVGEVNRLVAALLAANQPLSLPGIGTLRTERRAAKRLSRRKLAPPYRAVEHTSREEGLSLPAAIARAARCEEERARTVYERWLSYVYADGVLTIEGVGTLRRGHFALDPAFERQLNPQGHEPVRIRRSRRFDWVLWLGVAAILFVGGFWGYQLLRMHRAGLSGPHPTIVGVQPAPVPTQAAQPDAATAAGPDGGIAAAAGTDVGEAAAGPDGAGVFAGTTTGAAGTAADSSSAAADGAEEQAVSADVARGAAGRNGGAADVRGGSDAAAAQPGTAVPAVGSDDAERPQPMVSGRRYVVLGVFSSPANAARAARDAGTRVAGIRCAVHPFGAKWMVSPFASDDAAACTRFVNEYGDRFPGLWVYAAR